MLGLVAVTMLLLPLLYVGLVGALLFGLYLYVTEGFFFVLHATGDSGLFAIVCAITPLLIGWIALIGMARPLFASRTRIPERLAVEKESAPKLHELTSEVCQQLRVRSPHRIELSCELNASAGFDRGWHGFLKGRLVLTLGAPLVASLTQRELVGVIAHELGHFRQRAGMRTSFLIRAVNHWFGQVVYRRGSLDPAITDNPTGVSGYPWWMGLVLICAEIGSTAARSALWTLMMCGRVVAGALLRQMEYDADRCEVRLAGSGAFESTATKLAKLGAGSNDLLRWIGRTWMIRRRLPDDMAALTVLYGGMSDTDTGNEPVDAKPRTTNGWLDTHPRMCERVLRARNLAAVDGGFSDAPAAELFQNFAATSRRVTWMYFDNEWNLPVSKKVVLPCDEWLQAALSHQNQPAPSPV